MKTIQILLSNSTLDLSVLKNKFLLVDTSFLIDAFNYKENYKQLFELFNKFEINLISIDAVFYEFTKGTKSIIDYKKKVSYFNDFIHQIIPLDFSINDGVKNLSKALLKRSKDLSFVDSLLLSTLMKYSKSGMFLLSKDRSDISVELFPIVLNIAVETLDNNCMFSVYSYNEDSYFSKLQELLKSSP